jgi:toxin HigB-1
VAVIKSFRDKETQKLFEGRKSRAVSQQAVRRAMRKLAQLDAVEDVGELSLPPGNKLEKLTGERAEQWSVRIDGQYRICFRFRDGHAYDVEATDYH